jgi:hypothetical protein
MKRWIGVLAGASLLAACGGGSPAYAGSVTGVDGTIDTTDAGAAAFTGAVAMTVGTTYQAGRSLFINCTVAGNVSVTFFDGSALVVPVNVGVTILPFAVTRVNSSGTTATATYANLTWVPAK